MVSEATGTYRYNGNKECYLAHKDALAKFPEEETARLNLTQSRICFHENDDSNLQVMLVYHAKEHTVRRHIHPHKDEYLSIVKGCLKVHTYNKKGELVNHFVMSDKPENSLFCFIPKGCIHDIILETNSIFVETTTGPFNESSTFYIND